MPALLRLLARRAPAAQLLPIALACAVAACKSAGSALPAGPGLVAADRDAPAGVELVERPTWTAGDTFELVHGGEIRVRYRVERSEQGWRLVDQDEGRAVVLDDELCPLGEAAPDGAWRTQLDPVDPTFSWPLWAGKRWSGGFVGRASGGHETPLLVEYHCGEPETIQVPAGTVRAWPIWCTRSLAGGQHAMDRTIVLWYAPEFGWYARQLEGGVLVELVSAHRQTP